MVNEIDEVGTTDDSDWFSLKKLAAQAPVEYRCVRTKASDPMSWFFTSGTTGLPKMTEHTHASYGFAHQGTGKHWLDLTPDDVMWNVSDTGSFVILPSLPRNGQPR